MFLDNLQWSDPGSLDLLQAFLTDVDTHHLLVVGACRDAKWTPPTRSPPPCGR